MREALQAYVKRVGELAVHEHEHEPPPLDFLVLSQRSQFHEALARTPGSCPDAPKGQKQISPGQRPGIRFTAVLDSPDRSDPRPAGDAPTGGRIETTQEELAAYEVIRRLLGPARPVAYEDTVSYFKIHLAERYTWVMCRLYLGRKRPSVWVPLPLDQVQAISTGLMLNTPQEGWTCITLNASGEIEQLGDILRAAWDARKAIRTRRAENADGDMAGSDGGAAVAEPATAIANCHGGRAQLPAEPCCDERR